jgi:hypothetical protein
VEDKYYSGKKTDVKLYVGSGNFNFLGFSFFISEIKKLE